MKWIKWFFKKKYTLDQIKTALALTGNATDRQDFEHKFLVTFGKVQ